MGVKTREELDRAYIRYIGKISDYLNKQGKFEDDIQRVAIITGIESWLRLSPDGLEDDALMARLLAKSELWAEDKPESESNTPKQVELKVPYWKQTDNYRDANRTCFSSSMAMITEYLKPDELPDDDTYVKTVFTYGDTTDPNVQVKALNTHNIIGTYRQNMDFEDLDHELSLGYPVGVAILHRGPTSAPTGGHWIVCIGRKANGSAYKFNDPYGSILDGYQGEVENGYGVWYDCGLLKARWTADGAGSGWGMTCRKKQ